MKKILSILLIVAMILCTACASKNEPAPANNSSSVADNTDTNSSDTISATDDTDAATDVDTADNTEDDIEDDSDDAEDDTEDEPEVTSEPTPLDDMLAAYNWPTETKDITFFDGMFNLADLDVVDLFCQTTVGRSDSCFGVGYTYGDTVYSTDISEILSNTATTGEKYNAHSFGDDHLYATLRSLIYWKSNHNESLTQSMTYQQILDKELYMLSFNQACFKSDIQGESSINVFPIDQKLGKDAGDQEIFQFFMDAYGNPDYISISPSLGEIFRLYYVRGDKMMEINIGGPVIMSNRVLGIDDKDPKTMILTLCPEIEEPGEWYTHIVYEGYNKKSFDRLNQGLFAPCLFEYDVFVETYLNK